MARQRPEKIFHISVVGMSGTETERGATGVGKSCLCNRFLNPHQDKYFTDHISVISSSDFSGRIVNNDHFLYWGEVARKYDGDSMTFRVVEQTEFIDDSSFSPLRGSNTHNYFKRAAVTNLKSAEKVMYICKDQVGDETNFPQRILPDGKFPVDGFLIIYDVSKSSGHEKQQDWLTKLQGQLSKAKRPVVVVATKWDEQMDTYVRDARAFASRIKAPLIETSAQEGINVDLAFFTLACKIEKRGAPREFSYQQANEARDKIIQKAVDNYVGMLQDEVTNYHDLWTSRKRQYQNREVFEKVVELIGTKNAKTYFTRHTQRLRQSHQQARMKVYMSQLPGALENIFPDLKSISGRDWTECRHILPEMELFDQWFVMLPTDQTWRESEYIDTDDTRIPYDLLEGNETECENCFTDHVNRLNAAKRKEKMKAEFRKLLESRADIVLPYRRLDDDSVQDALSSQECFKELDESTRLAIYNVHQEDIQARAQADFYELLAEKHALLANVDIRQDPQKAVDNIVKQLENEPRYQRLSDLGLDRYIMLIKQLVFVHSPSTETCCYGDKCMEKQIHACIEKTVQKSPVKESVGMWDDSNNKLSIVVMGEDGLGEELESEIQSQSYDGDYTLDKALYSLDIRTIEGDVTHPSNRLITDRFTPKGCICVFTSLEGFQYVRDCLENTILSNEDAYNSPTLRDLAVVLMFGRSTSPEADTAQVREQAQKLCDRLNNCQIVDIPPENTLWQGKKFSESQIQDALRSVVVGQKYRSGTPNQTESDRGETGDSAFRIGLCMPCGDPFQPDLVLSPVTSHSCHATPGDTNCITCDMFLIDTRCRVEFEVTSYHLADSLRDTRVRHGYILVYAAQRKASLELLKWFLKVLQPIPTLVVAVCEDINSAAEGIAEGNRLVDQTETAKLVTANCSSFRDQTVIYNKFLKEAYDKRRETEGLFKTDGESVPLTPGMRPPIDIPSPIGDAHTPTSGGEEMYDQISQTPGRRHSTKTSNEALYAQAERRGSEPVRPSGALSPRPIKDLYASVDMPKRAAAPAKEQAPAVEDVYAVVNKPPKNSTPQKPAELAPVAEDVYAVVNKTPKNPTPQKAPEPAPVAEDMYAVVDKRGTPATKTPVHEVPEEADPIYGVVSKSSDRSKPKRSSGEEKKDPPSSELLDDILSDLYAQVKREDRMTTSTPDTNRTIQGSDVFSSEDKWKLPGMVRGEKAKRDKQRQEEKAAEEGMVDNVLYAGYNPPSPGVGPGDSLLYTSVGDSRDPSQSEYNEEGMQDNPLYASYSENSENRPRTGPPTLPKPQKLDLSKYPVKMEGLMRPLGSVNRPNDLPVWQQRPTGGSGGRGSSNQSQGRRPPHLGTAPPPFASPESDEGGGGGGYASPADALPFDQVRRVIGSNLRVGAQPHSGGTPPGIYSQPQDHLPRGIVQRVRAPVVPPPVATTPRPNLLSTSSENTPNNQSRQSERPTPYKRPYGNDARHKSKAAFVDGLNKLIENYLDNSSIEPGNTSNDRRDRKKKEKRDREKEKKMKKGKTPGYLPKKAKPPLEQLALNDSGVPPFIEQCVQRIEEGGLSQEGIYRVPGKAADIELIIKMFDEDQFATLNTIENLSANTVASALKQFFKNLPEPIIPYSTQDRMIADFKDMGHQEEEQFVERLPDYLTALTPVKKTVLTYMMKHMRRIMEKSEVNFMTTDNLSICWWPSMLHPQSQSFDDLANEALLSTIFKLIIDHSQSLFEFT